MTIFLHPLINFIGKMQGYLDVYILYRRIEKEERYWEPECDADYDLDMYISEAEDAIEKAKNVDELDERLYWLGESKRSIVRFDKVYKITKELNPES